MGRPTVLGARALAMWSVNWRREPLNIHLEGDRLKIGLLILI